MVIWHPRTCVIKFTLWPKQVQCLVNRKKTLDGEKSKVYYQSVTLRLNQRWADITFWVEYKKPAFVE